MKRVFTGVSVTLIALMLGTGCQTLTGRRAGDYAADKRITATVKSKLVAARPLSLISVDVDTVSQVVYLKGFVDTEQQKKEAEARAETVSGVRQVVNHVQVRGAAAIATAPPGGPAASPATGEFTARHAMTGEVTEIDAARGHVHLRTTEGELQLHFPPAALRNVQKGDVISIELAMKRGR